MGGGYGFSLAFALLHGNEVANSSRYKSGIVLVIYSDNNQLLLAVSKIFYFKLAKLNSKRKSDDRF